MALKTLDNSLEILEYFTKESPEWGVRELAKEVGKNHSIIHRILSTFEQHGFLNKNEQTNKYELGLKCLEYGLIVQDKLRISEMIDPEMNRLKDETGESIFLTWLDHLEGICLSISESSQNVKCAVTLGSRTPLYAGSSAKVIMAFLPPDKQQAIIEKGLKPWTKNTITDPISLLEDLQQIKNQGWSYSVGEYTENVVGVAIPIFNYKGDVTGSLTVGAPEYRLPESKVTSVLKKLQKSGEKIQQNIKRYRVDPKGMGSFSF
jgi:DNA-binding IclR family transcriptional regulator